MRTRATAVTVVVALVLVGGAMAGAQAAPSIPKCFGHEATIVGSDGFDNLEGTPGRDVILGLGGNDLIEALGGNDVVCGGAGDDDVRGGAGNDWLCGGAGEDLVRGERGRDRLVGEADPDFISGGPGRDTVSYRYAGGRVFVDLQAGQGEVTTAPNDFDSLTLVENLLGGRFNDTLIGDGLSNNIVSGRGSDEVHGQGGDDILDVFDGINANDTVDGGDGHDECGFDVDDIIIGCEAEKTRH